MRDACNTFKALLEDFSTFSGLGFPTQAPRGSPSIACDLVLSTLQAAGPLRGWDVWMTVVELLSTALPQEIPYINMVPPAAGTAKARTYRCLCSQGRVVRDKIKTF